MEINKIYHDSCLNIMGQMKSESVDLIITDPPYNSKAFEWDKKDNEFQLSWLTEAKRVLKKGGSFYMFFAPLNQYFVEGWIRENFTLQNIMVWYHPNLFGSGMSYGKTRYKSTWEVIFYATKGTSLLHNKNVSAISYKETGSGFDVINEPQPRPLLHKAQKPFKIIRKFLLCSSEKGDLVFDPFCGSGTTALVCKALERNYISCDTEEQFVKLANDRLANLAILTEYDKMLYTNRYYDENKTQGENTFI